MSKFEALFSEHTLTLHTTLMFAQVLAQDELFDVFNILVHIIAGFIVLLRSTRRDKKKSSCRNSVRHSTLT